MPSDVTTKYLSEINLAPAGPGSLASDAGMLGGWQSDEVDNSATKALDYILSGRIKTGATGVTGGPIEIVVVGEIQGGIYPDTFTASEGAITLSRLGSKDVSIMRAFTIIAEAANAAIYDFGPISVKSLFNGILPKKFVVAVFQATGHALAGSGSFINVMPQKLTVG